MSSAAQAPLVPENDPPKSDRPKTDPVQRWFERREALHYPEPNRTPENRAAANRANAQRSTGPRTPAGKHRSSLNALRHGLTAQTAVLPSEDPAAFAHHVQQFLDEYKPATPTESHFVHELANTAWRLNRIPYLEAELLSRAAHPPTEQAALDFDIVDAHRALATLGLHGQRLSRQFQKVLEQLRDIQEDRRRLERRQLTEAAEILARHQRKGLPWEPADDGFVFSKEQIERHARHLMRTPMPSPMSNNDTRTIGSVLFNLPPLLAAGAI